MKQKKQRGNFIVKQIILILIIFISIFLATLVGQFINKYIIYYGGLHIFPTLLDTPTYLNLSTLETAFRVSLYLVLYIYIGLIFLTSIDIKYLNVLKYNYFYRFLTTFLFILLPYTIEDTLANYIAFFIEPSEGAIAYYVLIFPTLLAIKALLLMLGLAWIFKKFKSSKK